MACAGVRVCGNSHSAGYSVSLNAMGDSVFPHELSVRTYLEAKEHSLLLLGVQGAGLH